MLQTTRRTSRCPETASCRSWSVAAWALVCPHAATHTHAHCCAPSAHRATPPYWCWGTRASATWHPRTGPTTPTASCFWAPTVTPGTTICPGGGTASGSSCVPPPSPYPLSHPPPPLTVTPPGNAATSAPKKVRSLFHCFSCTAFTIATPGACSESILHPSGLWVFSWTLCSRQYTKPHPR